MNKARCFSLVQKTIVGLFLLLGVSVNAQPEAQQGIHRADAAARQNLPDLQTIIHTAKINQEIIGRNHNILTYQKHLQSTATSELRYADSSAPNRFPDNERFILGSYGYTHKQKYSVSIYRDFPIEILIEDNQNGASINFKSKLLSVPPGDLKKYEKAQKQQQREIDRLYEEAVRRGKPLTAQDGLEKIKWDGGLVILECLTNSHFTNLYRDRAWARDAYAVNFAPAPSADKNTALLKKRLSGKLWIDAQSGWVIKAEVTTTGTNTYIQEPFCHDLWLPKYRITSVSDLQTTYSSYRINGIESVCDANKKSKLK